MVRSSSLPPWPCVHAVLRPCSPAAPFVPQRHPGPRATQTSPITRTAWHRFALPSFYLAHAINAWRDPETNTTHLLGNCIETSMVGG